MDEKKEGEGGGGTPPDLSKEIADLKAEIAALKTSGKPADKKEDDPDLVSKAKDIKTQKDKEVSDRKAMENALTFILKSEEFLKNNSSLLPKDVTDIFKAADKENYESAVDKANAIMSGIIKSFFSVEANTKLLTQRQKTVLDDYLKMTNNARQEKAQEIYDMVFEPAFETLKQVKKAEALNKGFVNPSDTENNYKNKLVALSKKHHLGEKQDA